MRTRHVAAACLLLIAAAPVVQPVAVQDEVRTRKLVLVDAAGKIRATFSASEGASDTTLLALRTPGGEGRLHLALSANGNAMITLDDHAGVRVLMGTNGTSSAVIVYDGKGNAIHSFETPR